MTSPFDYIKSFSSKFENVWKETNGESYTPFVINRGLSFMQDTILYANFINRFSAELPPKAQHDFYLNAIPKGKRFGKWEKQIEPSADIQLISEYYCINNRVAEKYLSLLSSEQLQIIRDKMSKGGKHGR